MAEIPNVTLNNGFEIPQLGLGMWRVSDGKEAVDTVKSAIEAGYRLIDTATLYGNEQSVGEALRASSVPRHELFVTTKVFNDSQGHDKTLEAFDSSLSQLGLDYIDLYLIHWPVPQKGLYLETWDALCELYQSGKVKAIGVCNFNIEHLEKLLEHSSTVPSINQVECHPHLPQNELREYCKEKDIQLEAWRPLGGPKGDLLNHELIASIAKKHDRTPAQILLRWSVQIGNIVIPKSVHPSRMKENIEVFDFKLDNDDMVHISSLNTGERYGPDPATFEQD